MQDDIGGRLTTLGQLYGILEGKIQTFSQACGPGCADCCTPNVTMTSLEAAHIFSYLEPDEIRALKERLVNHFPEKRFRMKMTLNRFARACLNGEDIPEEENDPSWGRCPLLDDDRCTIYRVRPLGCRVMISDLRCREQGFARMEPLALTLSNIVTQKIEQLDIRGFSANLSDVLLAYIGQWERDAVQGDTPLYLSLDNPDISDRKEIFLRNRTIPALMVPPELREDAAPLLKEIAALGRD